VSEKQQMILGKEWNLPREVCEIKGKDPGTYLQFNSHMVTFYQQTYGELSRFFLALRDGRLIGSHCPKCKQVLVPATTWHCPNCEFEDMKEVDLPHKGVLAATAPITIFPSASFLADAPFCRGYVDVAKDAPIASFLPSRLRTTTGLPRPGIFVKGLELKLVFEDSRIGCIRDIFWVPMSEVPAKLRDAKPLLASKLDFAKPVAPTVERSEKGSKALTAALAAMRTLAANVGKSPRAQKDLGSRTHSIGVKTGGGSFTLKVAAGGLSVADGLTGKPDFVLVAQDAAIFTRWVADGSLTDAAVEGKLWLPNQEAFGVLPILDRLPRSVRRDAK
jgi:uncharacterized OB-fold protein